MELEDEILQLLILTLALIVLEAYGSCFNAQ